MKKFRHLMLVGISVLLSGQSFATTWSGHAPADVADGSTRLYLYNVGTGLWIEAGGKWGTEAVTSDVGMPLTLSAYGSFYNFTATVIAEGADYMGKFGRVNNNSNYNKWCFFTDRTSDATNLNFTLTLLTDTAYVYSLKVDTAYVVATGKHKELTTSKSDTILTNKNAQWMLVTLADRQDYFHNTLAAQATDASPADGTFIIYDQNFNRKNNDISHWLTGSDKDVALSNGKETVLPSGHECATITTTTYTYSGTCTHTYDSVYYTIAGRDRTENTKKTTYTHNVTYTTTDDKGESLDTLCGGGSITYSTGMPGWYDSKKTVTFTSDSIRLSLTNTETTTTTQDVTTYYVGNGYAEGVDTTAYHEADKALLNNIVKNSDGTDIRPQESFGGYNTANIHGDGVITQEYTTETAGWYIISCDGFTTQEGAANLFFYSNNTDEEYNSSTTPVTYLETAPETYAIAGKLLQEDESYRVSAKIFAHAGDKFSFGVEVRNADCSTWTCIDNFQISYAGSDKDTLLVLSELQEDMEYINAQVDAEKSYTLALERSLTADQWNSLILPVSLTTLQVRNTFGTNTKLSVIEGITDKENHPTLINFKSVDLTDDAATAITAGTLYIIKPTIAPKEAAGKEFKVICRTAIEEKYEVGDSVTTIKFDKPYYLINQVALTAAPETTNGIVTQSDVPGNDELGTLNFKGTYIRQTEEVIPAGSFLIWSDGNWYHTHSKSYAVKGFRTWIEPTNESPTTVTFANDGIETASFDNVYGIATSIQGLREELGLTNAAGKVYNLNGQLVRSGSDSTEGLAKGIYIVNGKKYIVK